MSLRHRQYNRTVQEAHSKAGVNSQQGQRLPLHVYIENGNHSLCGEAELRLKHGATSKRPCHRTANTAPHGTPGESHHDSTEGGGPLPTGQQKVPGGDFVGILYHGICCLSVVLVLWLHAFSNECPSKVRAPRLHKVLEAKHQHDSQVPGISQRRSQSTQTAACQCDI